MTQAPRQRRLEMRQRIAGDADGKFSAGRDLDDTLVPAVGLFDRLVNRQRVDEFVGDDDDGAARNLGEGAMPQNRHAEAFQPLLLRLLQLGADFDQMNDERCVEVG